MTSCIKFFVSTIATPHLFVFYFLFVCLLSCIFFISYFVILIIKTSSVINTIALHICTYKNLFRHSFLNNIIHVINSFVINLSQQIIPLVT